MAMCFFQLLNFLLFFFIAASASVIYTLSLHDALPISAFIVGFVVALIIIFKQSSNPALVMIYSIAEGIALGGIARSEEHTSELQSHVNLVCRLLLEKKKKN